MGFRVHVSEIEPYLPNAQAFNNGTTQQERTQHRMVAMKRKNPEDEQVETNSNQQTNQVGVTEDQELQGIQNSNGEPNQEWLKNSTAGNDSSATRTKPLCCSQNEDSMDFVSTKHGQTHLVNALNEKATLSKGYEEALCKDGGQNSKEMSDMSSSLGPPPGFEVPLCETEVVTNTTERIASPSHSVDSLEQLAKESIQVGNLLGLKITQNEKAAEEIITRSLRSNRARVQQTTEKSSAPRKVRRRL